MNKEEYTEEELKEVFLEALEIYVYSMSDEALRDTLEGAILKRNRELYRINNEKEFIN